MRNLKEAKTTFIGLVFGAAGVFFFIDLGEEISTKDMMILAVCAAGFVGFLAAPDRIIDVFFGWIKPKK